MTRMAPPSPRLPTVEHAPSGPSGRCRQRYHGVLCVDLSWHRGNHIGFNADEGYWVSWPNERLLGRDPLEDA